MKYTSIIVIVLVMISGLVSCNSQRPKEIKAEWQLVWEEDFNGSDIDYSVWSKIPRGKSDWNNYMSDYDSLYEVANGNLILRGIVNNVLPNDTAPFITGGVYTKDKIVFGEGRLEIRAKLNGAKGAWPAFWMLPEDAQWPHGGEIDIMERLDYDSIVYQTVHTNYTYNLNIKNPPNGATAPINPEDYNTYAVEKRKDTLSFFVNNNLTFQYPRIETDKVGQFPFNDQDFYLLIDMQLGGSWVGKVDPETLPVEMYIDRVRFYTTP
ncbi:MAG: glycoside hydrolase family 16 protein [Fermentimonas sp.]|jgi:beta-glucanase (GH16 family)|nr:glycoside hydrolase family 16 protein [Fermentimonas sp.]MBP7105338.1 glycoside hydrolase family 16 protein [Fermentimonas sp.]